MDNRQTNIRKTTKQLAFWTLMWLVSLAAATFGKALVWQPDSWPVFVLVGLNVLIGIMMLKANAAHLASLDELEVKMHAKAMALSLGFGLIFAVTLGFFSDWGIITTNFHVGLLMVSMSLAYMLALFIEKRQYD